MHHVPLDFEPKAIQGVLACMTPDAARIMWASKAFQVRFVWKTDALSWRGHLASTG